MALPAPPLLTPTTRFQVSPLRQFLWIPTLASKSAPTLAEVNAGTNLTFEIAASGVSGFTVTTANLDAPDAGTSFTSQVTGRTSAADSSIKFYASTAGPGADIRALLTFALTGFIGICTEGIVTGGKMDVWPVTVRRPMDPNDTEAVATIEIPFSVTSIPAIGVAIPTA